MVEWATYLENGGEIYPQEILTRESDLVQARPNAFKVAPFNNTEEVKADNLIELAA